MNKNSCKEAGITVIRNSSSRNCNNTTHAPGKLGFWSLWETPSNVDVA